jgi:murein DD-endopeptidase MepM/ murein hydrolase activator NlpD
METLPEKSEWYLHLDPINVTLGQKLSLKDRIGTAGDIDVLTGSHLHFEIRIIREKTAK